MKRHGRAPRDDDEDDDDDEEDEDEYDGSSAAAAASVAAAAEAEAEADAEAEAPASTGAPALTPALAPRAAIAFTRSRSEMMPASAPPAPLTSSAPIFFSDNSCAASRRLASLAMAMMSWPLPRRM
jgi:hypothetical protein